jgi:hypothetical protein
MRRRIPHVAGGADALLEELQLVVEAVRVEAAVRSTQAGVEGPALAGAQFALRLRQHRILVEAAVPA